VLALRPSIGGRCGIVVEQVESGQAEAGPLRVKSRPGGRLPRAEPLAGEAAVPAAIVTVAYHGAQYRIVAAIGEHRLTLLMPAGAAAPWSSGATAMLCGTPANANLLDR
jgi:hypothetical protein